MPTNLVTHPDHPHAAPWEAKAAAVAAMLAPRAHEHDLSGELDVGAFDMIREAGLGAALVPRELGGGGASHAEMGAVLRGLAAADGSVAVTLAMHSHVVATLRWKHGHGADASSALGKVADGALLASTGASDWLTSSGSARRVHGGYRVTGRKAPVSGCEVAAAVSTTFLVEQPPDDAQVIHVSVPMSAGGVSIERTWDTLGLRATGSHTVVIDDVFVPDEAVSLVRVAGEWHPVWNTILGCALPLIMSAYLGIADRAVELAVASSAARSSDDTVGALVGEMVNDHLVAADAVTAMFAEAADLSFDNTDQLAARMLARKSTAAGAAIRTVSRAMEAVGGRGYGRDHEIARLFRDVNGCRYHPLPHTAQTRLTGRLLLGG